MKSVYLLWLRHLQEQRKYRVMILFSSRLMTSRECGIDISTAYTALETASDRLFTRFFGYTTQNGDRVKVRWLQKVIYKAGQGGSELYFTDEVLLFEGV